jgi:hypothetical protein
VILHFHGNIAFARDTNDVIQRIFGHIALGGNNAGVWGEQGSPVGKPQICYITLAQVVGIIGKLTGFTTRRDENRTNAATNSGLT